MSTIEKMKDIFERVSSAYQIIDWDKKVERNVDNYYHRNFPSLLGIEKGKIFCVIDSLPNEGVGLIIIGCVGDADYTYMTYKADNPKSLGYVAYTKIVD